MSNEKQESLADIIAEMRDLAANRVWHNHTDQRNRERVLDLADRLEAALKRERKGFVDVNVMAAALHERLYSKSLENDDNTNCTAENKPGNAAAMREALEAARKVIKSMGGYWASQTLPIIDAALAAPPRNCDVGTAQEQEARFHDTGELYHTLTLRNALSWAQMPYEEGGANA